MDSNPVEEKFPCPACGTLNKRGAKFCGSCGRNLGEQAASGLQSVATSAVVVPRSSPHTGGGDGVRWEYADFVSSMVGDFHRVVAINGQIQDLQHGARGPIETLNEMGSEGWELVARTPLVPPSSNAVNPRGVWEYLLKRQR